MINDERRGALIPADFVDRYKAKRKGLVDPAIWNGMIRELACAVASMRITSFLGGKAGWSMAGQSLEADGGCAGTAAAVTPHAYTVSDASSGATPKVGVTPGTHNGVVPTINGSAMNVKIGSPLAYPVLTLGAADTRVYFQIDYNASNVITSVEIMSCTEAGWTAALAAVNIVSGTAGSDYKLLSTIVITYASGSGAASVQCNNDAVSGPQSYSQCGAVSYSTLA